MSFYCKSSGFCFKIIFSQVVSFFELIDFLGDRFLKNNKYLEVVGVSFKMISFQNIYHSGFLVI